GLNILTARRLNILPARGLNILTARRLNILPARGLNILTPRSLLILTSAGERPRRLNILALGDPAQHRLRLVDLWAGRLSVHRGRKCTEDCHALAPAESLFIVLWFPLVVVEVVSVRLPTIPLAAPALHPLS